MKVSLILCTKNGNERLRTCLSRLDGMDAPQDTELFLIDNGSTDGVSYEILQDFASKSRFDTSVMQTFTPGNSAGRNQALGKLAGEIVLFIDDDCYVEPDFVRAWIAVFSKEDVGYASGMITNFDDRYPSFGCKIMEYETRVKPGRFVPRGYVHGSNMAFRRECLESVGRFDERFGSGTPLAGEDWDLGLRASCAGWGGGYFPGPKVAHDHRRTAEEARERLVYYDYGGGAVYAKNTLSRIGARVFYRYLFDLKTLTDDRERAGRMIKGYTDFLLHRLPARRP